MSERNNDPVEVNVTFRRYSTPGNQFLIEDANGRERWLPVKECTLDPKEPERYENVTITMPEWLAVKEGLV